ncbi:MAG: hypothetical protein KFW21_07065 [Spirochaetota bacterium]|nr:hypothetical protein [Spirochaetota bacterium]
MGLKNGDHTNKTSTANTHIPIKIKTQCKNTSLGSNFSDIFRWGIFLHSIRKKTKNICFENDKSFYNFFEDVFFKLPTIKVETISHSLRQDKVQVNLTPKLMRYLNSIAAEEIPQAVVRYSEFILNLDSIFDFDSSENNYEKLVNIYACILKILFQF